MKKCPRCKIRPSRPGLNRIQSYCAECHAANQREWRKKNGFQETRNALTAAIQYIERIRVALQECMPQIEPCGSKYCSDMGHRDCPYGVARRALAENVPRVTFPVRCLCKRCGHQWTTRVGVPIKCPKCKSKLWNKDYERNPARYARMRKCA